MNGALGDKDHISRFHPMSLITYGDRRFAAQDILLVLHRVGVTRHPASLLHGKFAQRKIGTFLRRDQDLDRCVFSCSDIFRFYIIGMFDWHNFLLALPPSLAKHPRRRTAAMSRYIIGANYGVPVFVGQGV